MIGTQKRSLSQSTVFPRHQKKRWETYNERTQLHIWNDRYTKKIWQRETALDRSTEKHYWYVHACVIVDVRACSSMFVCDRRCSSMIVVVRDWSSILVWLEESKPKWVILLIQGRIFSLTNMGAALVYACTSSLATTTTQLKTCTINALKICQTLRNHTIKLALSMLIFGLSGPDMLWIFMFSSVS